MYCNAKETITSYHFQGQTAFELQSGKWAYENLSIKKKSAECFHLSLTPIHIK